MRIRYLVFDADCPVCNTLAKTIAASANGKLQALNIQSSKARFLLDQAYPAGWNFAPYFIVVDNKQVKAWKGVRAALRLGVLIGPRKALRFWNLARKYGVTLPIGTKSPTRYDQGRRWMLKSLIGVGLGSLLSKATGLQVADVQTVFANHTCDACYSGCYDAGSETGCTCHTACGTCPPCDVDYYHQLWCYCWGQIKPCLWLSCDGCGICA